MRAKELIVRKWLNTPKEFEFSVFSSQIKVIHVFQMLCPGCVYRGIPQTIELFHKFNSAEVAVVGLHSVFENHHAMKPAALEVFINEWKLPFPVAIDKHYEDEWMPETMKAYYLQGTPSLIIINHIGEIQLCSFGHTDSNEIEKLILKLIKEKRSFNEK